MKLAENTISKEEIEDLCKWLQQENTPQLTKGQLTVKIQEKWASYVGTKHSVFVNSGSSAILLTLSALKQSGRLNSVVVPALSWATDVSSPLILGIETHLCDCNLEDLSCDLNHLESIFKEKRPSCFILVSVLGLPPRMDEIVSLCEKYNVILLEDNCESVGSRYKDRLLGTFGLASFYSMYFGHHISSIEGGFINTDDDDLNDILLMIRNHGWARDLSKIKRDNLMEFWGVDPINEPYTFYYSGFNCRSTDLQAFLGLSQIDKVGSISYQRFQNYLAYKDKIKSNKLQLDSENFVSNFAFPILLNNRTPCIEHLAKQNIEVRPIISGSMGQQPLWVKYGGRKAFVNADTIHSCGFYIPNHHLITSDEINFVSDIINMYN